ncbi:PhzF family phenazine biosynthesis protein [uncultured Methanobrevibacter sp.]|uniref:PhzF family phenazine biosynthesis protein n=1 Tax=uncultured Methanobrevibacter sp. TaxID=253161 RepID=UPI0025D7E8DA|nr:PhzF family phenazine biosynthesis protein [uncultured Methanobrevibacter sp.]
MKQYVVDVFTNQIFKGNPAAVCILDEWINEEVMLNIAIENNLSETAFAVKNSNQYEIRWFTPGGEVDLCGHATLATAFVILNFYENTDEIYFKTIDNIQLSVKRRDTLYEMEFPAYDLKSVNITDEIINALGVKPNEIFKARDLLCVLDSPQSVIDFKPNLDKIEKLEGLLLHITAKGKEYDCVSRSFGPKLNIPEDPVCGSGHCHIVPY